MPRTEVVPRAKKSRPLPAFPDGRTPTWEIAYLYPAQGSWTEEDYFALAGSCEGSPRLELSNGHLDVLPMPTQIHQLILFFLAKLLESFAQLHAPGMVLPSGMKMRLGKTRYRDPDVVYMKAEHARRRHNEYWDGADLVMEVVSPDPKDEERDYKIKRREYARGRIPEYWIIDPQKQLIRVLKLKAGKYHLHGDFGPGTQATSALLPGFTVAVDEVLAPPGSAVSD